MSVWLIGIPFFSGLILFALNRKNRTAQILNILFNLLWAALFIVLWSSKNWSLNSELFPVQFSWNWLPQLKSRFSLGLDGLNIPLIALNIFLSLCLSFYSYGKEKLSAAYLGLFSILNATSVGSLMAADALAFYLFWEFMLIPMYFLIGRWGSANRIYAAVKFFAFTMAGSLAMLAAIVALYFSPTVASLSWHDIALAELPFIGMGSLHGLCFLGFLVAFLVKIPVWPFHTWLPDAHTEAPTGASVILAGVLLKLGVYGIARWCLPLFPEASMASAPWMLILGCCGIILGSLAAWKQKDIKRTIAYSSVAHLGFMVLGLFSLNQEGLEGAMFQNIAHGLSTGALFLIFGIVYDRTHNREISQYGGLAQKSPWLMSAFVLSAMASIGLPGLPGFVGEFLILGATFFKNPWIASVALLGVLLGAIYMLSMLRRVAYGPVSALVESHPVSPRFTEWLAVIPLIVALLVFGLQPQLLIRESSLALSEVLSLLR